MGQSLQSMVEFRNIDFDKDMELCVDFRRDSYWVSFPNSISG